MNLSAEIIILISACACLLQSAFAGSHSRWTYRIAQFGLLLSGLMTLREWPVATLTQFNHLMIQDNLASLLKLFVCLIVFGCFLYGRDYVKSHRMPEGEYYSLGLFSTLGMMVIVSSNSFLTLYLGLEVMALPIYAMVALQRDSEKAVEAGLKYFVMGAIASGILLYGMSLFYGASGSLELAEISSYLAKASGQSNILMNLALVFILVGIGFKLAAAPFHMWAPDVYTGAPTSVTLFLATGPKLAALGFTFRLLTQAFAPLTIQWQGIVIIMALLSIGLGNLFAITQFNIKRLLAYSAISQIGYMLLGLVAGTKAGYSAALFYMIVYSISSLGAFGFVALLSRRRVEIENIDDLRGLNQRNPWLAFMMLLMMFSFAGIPPTVGFFAKFFVLKAIIDVGYTWIAAVALAFAILGAFYYIRIIKVMYFDTATDLSPIAYPKDMQVAISVNGLSMLFLGLLPSLLMAGCQIAFR